MTKEYKFAQGVFCWPILNVKLRVCRVCAYCERTRRHCVCVSVARMYAFLMFKFDTKFKFFKNLCERKLAKNTYYVMKDILFLVHCICYHVYWQPLRNASNKDTSYILKRHHDNILPANPICLSPKVRMVWTSEHLCSIDRNTP